MRLFGNNSIKYLNLFELYYTGCSCVEDEFRSSYTSRNSLCPLLLNAEESLSYEQAGSWSVEALIACSMSREVVKLVMEARILL